MSLLLLFNQPAGAVSHDATGALVGQGSSVVGTARLYRVHTSSGSLTGQGSSVSGVALRYRVHVSTGSLTGQGSIVNGSGAHTVPAGSHNATGALTGQGSVIDGISLLTVVSSSRAAGGGSGRRKNKLVVVEYEGKEYRVSEWNIYSFLQALRTKEQVKAEKRPVKVKSTGKSTKKKVEAFYVPEVRIVKAPDDVFYKIQEEVDRTNEVLSLIYEKLAIMQDDEEVLLLTIH